MIRGKKIGFMPSGSYTKMSVEEVCESIKRIGYDAVEWPQSFASPRNHSLTDLEHLVKTTYSFDLEISEVVVQQDLVLNDEVQRRDRIDFIKQCLEAYSSLGIETINLFTGPVPWGSRPLIIGSGITEGKAWDMVFEAFDELVPVAERTNVNIAVENVWGMICNDFFSLKFLIDHYRSTRLGVNYDPSHDILAGHTDIGWIVRQLGVNHIKHVHLKDAVGLNVAGKFLFPLPGEGKVDWKSFAQVFDEIGYQGVMSVEFESFDYVSRILGGDWEKAAQLAFNNYKILFGQ